MNPSIRNTLPIVLLPVVLALVLTAMIALLAVSMDPRSREASLPNFTDNGFTVTVPGNNPQLAQRLEQTLGEWLTLSEPSGVPAVTAEIRRSLADRPHRPVPIDL